MQINECIELLEIKVPYNENELKKAYYKKCLVYHPDKNKEGLEMFKKVQEAYEKLKKYDIKDYKKGTFNKFCEEENINELSYVELLNKYINSFSNKYGWSNDFIKNSIEKLLINAQDVSLKFYEHLELEKSLEIYESELKPVRMKMAYHTKVEVPLRKPRIMSKVIMDFCS